MSNSVNAREEDALIALRQILRATELNSRALAKQSGLNPSQLILLHLIDDYGQVSPSQAARHMSISQGTATVLADKLAERGLIVKSRDESDKRRFNLTLTDQGRAIMRNAPDMLQASFRRQFSTLENWEQASIISALERVSQMLDAAELDCSPVLDVGEICALPDS